MQMLNSRDFGDVVWIFLSEQAWNEIAEQVKESLLNREQSPCKVGLNNVN